MDRERALARTWSFERAVQDACARSRREFEYGTALYNHPLPRVYDSNFVRFERGFGELTGDVVEAAADTLQRHLGHRKVTIPDEHAGARVGEELKDRGWRVSTLATMAYDGPRERNGLPPGAEEVSAAELRAARMRSLEDGIRDPDARRQIVAFTELLARAMPTRLFAARADHAEIGSFCALFRAEGVAQVDEVSTVERHRRRGLGAAVVEGALRASLAAGDELIFLVADEGDWPKGWYERLGFRTIGRRYELLKS